MRILINAPSLNTNENVSGISSISSLIIKKNSHVHDYIYFKIGSKDNQRRNLNWLINLCFNYIRWIKVLFFNKIDLVHFNLPLQKYSILRDTPLLLLAIILRKKVIIHIHGGEYLFKESIPHLQNILLKIVFSLSKPIIVLSKMEERELKKKFGCKSIFVLPNAVDISTKSKIENNFNNILFLGRIHKNKGLKMIKEAFKILINMNQEFTFTLCGDGPDKDWFVKNITEILGHRFEYKGVVNGFQKDNIISGAGIFLLPSAFEGLPMALLETMSKGVIPIVSNVGSILDVVIDEVNGLVLMNNNALDLAIAINKLLKQKQMCMKLSRNAKKTITENFNIEEYIKNLNSIYHNSIQKVFI